MFDIASVYLEDFRSFRGQHIFELPTEPGLYAITGKNLDNPRLEANGAGKSTLLEAIHWCFYGHTSRGLRANDVVNWAAKGCTVIVYTTIGNDRLTVARTQSPNSLRLNSKPVDQATLQKALRIGPDAFTYAVQIPQYGKAFFELLPGDKLTLFSRIMELDYWLDKSKEAGELADEILAAQNTAKRDMARNAGQLETIDGDIENLKIKDKTFVDAEAQRIKGLKQEHSAAHAKLLNIEEAIAFDHKALNNLTVKLGKTERGAKKCPTCGAIIPNKDLSALLTNQSDFERQLRNNERIRDSFSSEIRTLQAAMVRRDNPYAGQIAEKLEDKKDTLEQQKRLRGDIASLGEDHTAVSFWVGGFKRVRLFIVEETLRQLELEINNSLASLGLIDWHIALDVERENKSGGITKGFTVLIHAPGAPGPVKFEAWSGGETQRLCLAGDLGLANLIMERAGLRSTLEFYDEPSQHLSNAGILDLAETLHQRATLTGRRIMVIEHNLLDYPYTGTITVVKNNDGSHIELN